MLINPYALAVAGGGGPASPYPLIRDRDTFSTSSTATAHDLNIPAGREAGDLLLAYVRGGGSSLTITTADGWALLATRTTLGGTSVFARVATGDANDALTVNSSPSRTCAAVVYTISDWYGALEDGVEATIPGTNTLDPPELTPSWGEAENLWFAGAASNIPGRPFTGDPADYGDFDYVQTSTSTETAQCHVRIGNRVLETTAEDPGTYAIAAGANNPHAVTIAVRPAA